MQLYEKDGVAIFHTDYQLLLKLLDKYPKGPLRTDAWGNSMDHVRDYIEFSRKNEFLIICGNSFYYSVLVCM